MTENFIYAQPISEKKRGETQIYRRVGYLDQLASSPEGMKNLQEVVKRTFEKFAGNNLLGTLNKEKKTYEWRTYNECSKLSQTIGTAILEKELYYNTSGEGLNTNINLFGVYSKNREDWLLLDYAGMYYNYSIVPLYDTLGQDSMMYILDQTNLNTVFISSENIPKLLKLSNTYHIKKIVSFDNNLHEDIVKQVNEKGFELYYYWELVKEYQDKVPAPLPNVTENDIYSFCYTSGTTGNPKGVLHTQRNVLSYLVTCDRNVGVFKVNQEDIHFSYLPLPHIYERQVALSIFYQGGAIGFYAGDIFKMNEDLQILKPTLFASVPRIFNKYYSKIKESFDGLPAEKKAVVDLAIKEKIEAMRRKPDVVSHEKWDELIFKDIRKILGGRVRGFITGGAALSGEIAEFLKIAFSGCFFEGYGQTESFGGVFSGVPSDGKYGDVGGINSSCEFKLVDIPEMGYSSEDIDERGNQTPRGEVLVRGNQVCGGYYKDPERTKQIIDDDGWLYTGDVGQLNSDLSLKLIDRKGNLFKLSQGEYIAPEKIENIYSRAKGVQECFVYGEALRSYLVGLVVIDHEYIIPYAKQYGIAGDINELCNNKQIRNHILENMLLEGKKALLIGIEQVKGIKLDPKPLVLHGVTTNTFKIKRPDAKKKFKDELQAVYKEIDETQNPNQ